MASRLLGVDDDLGRVLAEPLEPERRHERVPIRQAHEEPESAPLERLVAEVLDQRGATLVDIVAARQR